MPNQSKPKNFGSDPFQGTEPKRFRKPPHNPGLRDLVEKRKWSRPLLPETVKHGFDGWHENGYLPHRDEPGLIQFVTFHLADAFPATKQGEWKALLEIEDHQTRRKELESYLDKSSGECLLRHHNIGELVENAFRFFHGERYELCAWVVMPNHVHLLFKVQSVPMSQLMDTWKGYTAKEVNKLLGRKGQFWQEGYWDTYMRETQHEERTRRYIEGNPVNAHLARNPKDWPFSSARFRDENGILRLPSKM